MSLGLGAIIGAAISWWIYNMQNKTSMKQDETLRRINQLEESHDSIEINSTLPTTSGKTS